MLLDYDKLTDFIDRYFGSSEDQEVRRVGRNRSYDSGYFDVIRFFGSERIDPEAVEIKYEPGEYCLINPTIRKFAEKIETCLRQQGRIYDGPLVMQVAAANMSESPFSITVKACTYGVFAGSCFALDEPDPLFDGFGGTLREYYKRMTPNSVLESHPLALCIGVCGILIAETPARSRLLLVHRSGNLASLENSVGPSAAGSIDFTTSCRTLAELSRWSLSQEIREELGLADHEFSIEPLAWAREIVRGEKPQLFCLIRTSLTEDELSIRLRSSLPAEEFDSFEFVELSDGLPEALYNTRANHEAMMNCLLVEEYLEKEDC
ncbi:MAG: hypothetical protein KOO62_08160 [candidate division Zixibacteria bacterium]|nr:hypothetical protein [candidate division Zixibacteria bacterium]